MKQGDGDKEDVITLADAAEFFASNAKFMGLLTLSLSVVLVSLAVFFSDNHSRELDLSIEPVMTELIVRLGQPPLPPEGGFGIQAAGFVQMGDFGEVDAFPEYNVSTKRVEVVLRAESKKAPKEAVPEVVNTIENGFQEMYEASLSQGIQMKVVPIERLIENNRAAISDLDQRIKQLSDQVSGEQDSQEIAQLRELEEERANILIETAEFENDVEYYEKTKEKLPRLADEAVSVSVVSDTAITQARTLTPVILLALLSSVGLTLLIALARTMLTQRK